MAQDLHKTHHGLLYTLSLLDYLYYLIQCKCHENSRYPPCLGNDKKKKCSVWFWYRHSGFFPHIFLIRGTHQDSTDYSSKCTSVFKNRNQSPPTHVVHEASGRRQAHTCGHQHRNFKESINDKAATLVISNWSKITDMATTGQKYSWPSSCFLSCSDKISRVLTPHPPSLQPTSKIWTHTRNQLPKSTGIWRTLQHHFVCIFWGDGGRGHIRFPVQDSNALT